MHQQNRNASDSCDSHDMQLGSSGTDWDACVISISAENADELYRLVQLNTNTCIDWFNLNHMTSKFLSLIVGKKDNQINEFQINNNFKIKVSNEVTLLGIQIDEQLKFDSHIDKICKKSCYAAKRNEKTS